MNENKTIDNPRIQIVKCVGAKGQDEKMRRNNTKTNNGRNFYYKKILSYLLEKCSVMRLSLGLVSSHFLFYCDQYLTYSPMIHHCLKISCCVSERKIGPLSSLRYQDTPYDNHVFASFQRTKKPWTHTLQHQQMTICN